MNAIKRAETIAELDALMQETGLNRRDTMLDALYDYYENEFPYNNWGEVFEPMSDDELFEIYADAYYIDRDDPTYASVNRSFFDFY